MKENKKKETKLRVASAKAGTARKCDLNYFPPEGSVSRKTLEQIADHGIDVANYPLSEMFLGRLVRCGLVASDGTTLTATQRTIDVLEGKLELPSTRGQEINRIMAHIKTVTDGEEFDALVKRLSELRDQQLERNAARAEEKEKKSA